GADARGGVVGIVEDRPPGLGSLRIGDPAGEPFEGALTKAGYPTKADPARMNKPLMLGVLFVFVIAATALFGPLAACLVELFPTRVRYTALSLPYHI
ncbi:unnamed protein product, partial [marine sediment metagenome]